ncbi:MAG TPA: hypothetical protein PLH75_05430 [Amaricoccus sp.]|uniref:hypothetical protein n=1 Tax=Amaricoccus sp. TaxID=1872485 RepID=UPI001D63EA70|nr:hypothetical protein [Amaricoccus sp.]MCB1373365.1 hypothetical protein [Paracoccaceae bacterium]MCC0067923.1 hypothetical protein [Rhodovulum sp.]MCB1403431.1 hypothetical protein [Paracoccaceae bacterium]HPG22211.1 hypothetical protein [Amaricoccus sp.]HRW14235.1 hypothetical protein [Amaricoccus sp.]
MILATGGLRHALIGLPLAALAATASAETAPERIEVEGEMVDSWCYFSGVMGGYEAVVGSAHHTCALWCAKGGIPVGLLADDGTIYLVLRLEGADPLAEPETLLTVASDRLVADGLHYQRDGVNYIVVEKVVENLGITNHNHEDYGPVPGFAIPEPGQ